MNICQNILNFIFPKKCSGCGKYGKYLCKNCLKNFSERQGKFFNLEKKFLEDKKIFEKIYSPFFYQKNPILKKILKEIKYKNKFSKFSGLEEKIFNEFKNFLEILNKDEKILNKNIYLIPAPLHWKKHLKRGFNQSEIFCNFLEKKGKQNNLNLKKLNLIKKIQNTKSQAQLTKDERLKNLKGVFKIKNKNISKKNNTFILIDDILSTGETMKNCAIEIKKEFKNSKVYGFAICSDKN